VVEGSETPRAARVLRSLVPLPLTSLVGRGDEIAATAAAVGRHRLVTLFGPAGAGKTRVAQHVAGERLAEHDGVSWVELMPVSEPGGVPGAVVAALPAAEVQGADPLTQLVHLIGHRDHLLVVDNCEHLVDAVADLVGMLLRTCPNVRVLATSRELLDVPGELAVEVRPLASPKVVGGAIPDLGAFEASRLFLERAPSLELDGSRDQIDAIAQICRDLDGLPLAVELAAARTRLLSARQIADGLHDRFSLLGTAGRSVAGHQGTLEGSIAWSFDLLEREELDLLVRLAVFPGPFDLEAATIVGRTGGRSVQLLGALADKSLVTVRPDGVAHSYRLLESVRAYGLRLLGTRAELDDAKDAHLEYALARAGAIGLELLGSLGSTSLARARAFVDDARTADAWAHARGTPEAVVDLHWPLMLFHQIAGTTAEVVASLEVAVRSPRLDLDHAARAHALLVGLPGQSGAYGDVVLARSRAPTAIRLARRNNDPFVLFVALSGASFAEAWSCADGRPFAREAVEVAEALGIPWLRHVGAVYLSLALFYAGSGLEAYEFSAATAARLEHDRVGGPFLGTVRTVAAACRLQLGPMSEVEVEIERARRATSSGASSRHAVVNCLLLPFAYIHSGRVDEGAVHAEATLRQAPTDGTLARSAALLGRALIHEAAGETDGMLECSQAAVSAFEGRWTGLWLWMSHAKVALAHAQAGNIETAGRLAEQLRRVVPDTTFFIVDDAIGITQCLVAQDADVSAAVGPWLDLAHREVAAGMLTANVRTLGYVAAALVDAGRPAEAMTLLGSRAAQAQRLQTSHPPCWQAPGATAETGARAALDAAVADERYSTGRSMTVEAVIGWLRRRRGSQRQAADGWESITSTEQAVIDQVAQGLTNAQAAEALFVTANTVKSHLSNIYQKLGVHSRASLTARAVERREGSTRAAGDTNG
jgi:predicted ATPase/DNA-binding CsgD family transcriptional regulator